MMKGKINLLEKFNLFNEPWSPKVINELNNYQFKIAWFEGEFIWHKHDETDEAFLVIEGEITIKLEEKDITLKSGELFVVPKGILHKPVAPIKSKVLIIEPKGVTNTENTSDPMYSPNDDWI